MTGYEDASFESIMIILKSKTGPQEFTVLAIYDFWSQQLLFFDFLAFLNICELSGVLAELAKISENRLAMEPAASANQQNPPTPQTCGTGIDESKSDVTWQEALLPEPGNADEKRQQELSQSILESFGDTQEKFGSVSTYLRQRYADKVEAHAFLSALHDLSKAGASEWSLEAKLHAQAPDTVQPMIKLPLGSFSFQAESSLKPDPDHQLASELATRFLREGFITVSEPLQVMQTSECLKLATETGLVAPWANMGALVPFSIGYLKGKARVHTLLALLSIMMDNKVDIAQETC